MKKEETKGEKKLVKFLEAGEIPARELTIYEKLAKIQNELKVPKNNYNKFSNFYYRSAEDILESVKPLVQEAGLVLLIWDEVVLIGERYYIKAIVRITDGTSTGITTEAFAREEEIIKGMSGSQITGSSSSYARKYALNGMFLIDDTKDADTRDNKEEVKEVKVKEKQEVKEPVKKGDEVLASRLRIKIMNAVLMEDLQNLRPEISEAGKTLTKEQFDSVIAEAKKKKEALKTVEISDEDFKNLDFNAPE